MEPHHQRLLRRGRPDLIAAASGNGVALFLRRVVSTNPRWVLWLAGAVAAPITEEIFFRGFLFKGLAASRLRWYGAAVITSLLWAASHSQYDWYGIFAIFAFGLILGTVRAMTNSTLLTIWLHGLVNVLALAEMAIALGQI
jgi:CAAX protease family protein